MNLSLRPIAVPGDLEFLHRVYASTREEELRQTGWDAAQKEAFTRMQFDAQHAYYQAHYAGASFDVIQVDGAPAGRLYLDRRADEIRIMDITLLPEFRGQGIGTGLLRQILAEGQAKNLPVTIHVEAFNPARWLYERLGFHTIDDKGVYLFMRWTPSAGA